ncbi:hypothetical protein [Streptomyces parvulus]|uniref:Uncharacterized protein n=2 Tax=Streptomyces parvulus TaxID=146923 RepID=A0ABV5DEZ1_9ACTN
MQPDIHMTLEEGVRADLDLQVSVEAWWRAVSEPISRRRRRPRSAEDAGGASRGDLDLAGER